MARYEARKHGSTEAQAFSIQCRLYSDWRNSFYAEKHLIYQIKTEFSLYQQHSSKTQLARIEDRLWL